MAFTPRIRTNLIPIVVNNGGGVMYAYDVQALLWSESHRRTRGGGWSGGGEFLQASQTLGHVFCPYSWLRNGVKSYGLAGGVYPLNLSMAPDVNSIVSSFGDIGQQRESARADFTSGWEKTRPGRPEASLAQFLIELRDFPLVPGFQALGKSLGKASAQRVARHRTSFFRDWVSGPVEMIPRKLQMQAGFFKSLGSEFLNIEFGWKPFIRDLTQLYVLSQTIDNRIRQIARDNGRGIRRRAEVSDSQSTSETEETSTLFPFLGCGNGPPNWSTGQSLHTVTTTLSRRSWYSARYRYYIPDVGSGSWIPKARRALMGALVTPSLLWELTPWSWMIDWFTNVGDVISNFSENAVDNLVADYAFCMINTKSTVTAVSTGSWKQIGPSGYPVIPTYIPGGSHNCQSWKRVELKARVRGSPYGLGVKWVDLSDRQLAILAALGISQGMF